MGFLGSIKSFFTRSSSAENPSTPLKELFELSFGGKSSAGVEVNEKKSVAQTAVWNAVRLYAESIGQVPFKVFEVDDEGNKKEARDHPNYRLLKNEANSMMTSMQWREAMMTHLMLWGNHFSEIKFSSVTARPRSLEPIDPWRVSVKIENGRLFYILDGKEKIEQSNIFHIANFSFDGIMGVSPIKKHRETIGVGLAATEYGGKFFGNGANVRGVAETDNQLSDKAYKRLKKDIESKMQGNSNAHGVSLFEEGLKYKNIGMPPADAQYIETTKLQVPEIARIYNLPPHMLSDLDNANYSNVNAMDLRFVKYSIMPWVKKIEQEAARKLFFEREKREGNIAPEFILDGLLRADIEQRGRWYKIMVQNGLMTQNEVRKKENLNEIEGADVLLTPTNNTDRTGDEGNGEDERIMNQKPSTNGKAIHNGGSQEL